jgi:hypothetical protein
MQAIRNGTVFVETGSNDHIRLYPFDQSGKKRQYRVYTLFESAKAAAAADTDKDYVSFRINELYVHDVPKPGEKLDPWKVYRVQKINANDGRIFFRHHAAASLDDNNARLIKSPNTLIGVKQVISILGVPR